MLLAFRLLVGTHRYLAGPDALARQSTYVDNCRMIDTEQKQPLRSSPGKTAKSLWGKRWRSPSKHRQFLCAALERLDLSDAIQYIRDNFKPRLARCNRRYLAAVESIKIEPRAAPRDSLKALVCYNRVSIRSPISIYR